MITLNDTISFEVAELLHLAGYDGPKIKYYNILNKHQFIAEFYIHSEAIFAPTYSEVIKWLSEYGYVVELNEEQIINALKQLAN